MRRLCLQVLVVNALPFELGAFLMGALRGWSGERGKTVTWILNAKRFPMKPNRSMWRKENNNSK